GPGPLHIHLIRQHDTPHRQSRLALQVGQNFLGALLQRQAQLGSPLVSGLQFAHSLNEPPPCAAFLICVAPARNKPPESRRSCSLASPVEYYISAASKTGGI